MPATFPRPGWLSEVRNVLSYGADPTGLRDSTDAIQEAINDGGSVHAPFGRYSFTQLALPATGVRLLGDGFYQPTIEPFGNDAWSQQDQRGTIFQCTQEEEDGLILTFDTADDAMTSQLRDFCIIGPGSGSSNGLNIGNSTGFVTKLGVSNVEICNFSTGLLLQRVEDSRFELLTIRGVNTGISDGGVAGTNQNVFDQTEVQYAGQIGIILSGAANRFGGLLLQNNSGTTDLEFSGANCTADDVYWESIDPSATTFTLSGTAHSLNAVHAGTSTMSLAGNYHKITRYNPGPVTVSNSASEAMFEQCPNLSISGNGALELNAEGGISVPGVSDAVFGSTGIPTTATAGFVHIASCAGPPTGVPSNKTGAALVWDSTDGRLYAYVGGAWHYIAQTA